MTRKLPGRTLDGKFILDGYSHFLYAAIASQVQGYMRRQGRLIFRILLPALLLLPECTAQAQFTYTTNNGVITITGYTGPGGEVTVPDTITGCRSPSLDKGMSFLPAHRYQHEQRHQHQRFAFSGCYILATMTAGDLNPAYSGVDGILFDHSQTTFILCPQGKAGNYFIPESVKNIR